MGAEATHKTTSTCKLERETGIEPVSLAWKAKVLPLNYSRDCHKATQWQLCSTGSFQTLYQAMQLVEKAGFEPA
jgi:hypothetical protein